MLSTRARKGSKGNKINLGIQLDKQLDALLTDYLEKRGLSKRQYFEVIICRDLKVKFIPEHVEITPEGPVLIPAKYVKLEE